LQKPAGFQVLECAPNSLLPQVEICNPIIDPKRLFCTLFGRLLYQY
jgi:hypothetical protein